MLARPTLTLRSSRLSLIFVMQRTPSPNIRLNKVSPLTALEWHFRFIIVRYKVIFRLTLHQRLEKVRIIHRPLIFHGVATAEPMKRSQLDLYPLFIHCQRHQFRQVWLLCLQFFLKICIISPACLGFWCHFATALHVGLLLIVSKSVQTRTPAFIVFVIIRSFRRHGDSSTRRPVVVCFIVLSVFTT
jgi:hypothetical protein